MLVDMFHSAFDLYVIRFTEKAGESWWCSTMYESYTEAELHAEKMREAWDVIDSFSIKPVWNWLLQL